MIQEQLKQIAWESANTVIGHDPSVIRKDACGAWIMYAEFNNPKSDFGWVIDHVYPVLKLRTLNVSEKLWNDPLNIRALHWQNNWSKANSYPMYTSFVASHGDANIKVQNVFWVSEELQYRLRKLFKIEE